MTTLAAVGAAAALMTASVATAGEWSGGVWAANNYLDRGVSLSSNKPTLQGELAHTLENDVYAGAFTSTVHDGERYGQEFQLKLGVAKETAAVEWDAFVNQHVYASPDRMGDQNYWEMELDLAKSLGPVTAVAAFVRSPVEGALEGYNFLGFESERELPRGLKLHGAFGRMLFTENAGDDYTFYSSGLSWTHARGFQVMVGAETAGLNGDLQPVFRIGRAL